MKKTLLVAAMAAVCAVFFTACPSVEKTTADYLMSPKKGWVLDAAMSSPAYVMDNGEIVTDLMNGYLLDYELDDVMTFSQSNGFNIQTINPGNLLPGENDEWGYTEEYASQWMLDTENDGWLWMQVPFFYDEVQEYCHILSVNDDILKFNCTMNDDELPAKPTYTFTLTYVPAK
jgi:hypothetical protein